MDEFGSLSIAAKTLWAKKRSEDGHEYWLPLVAHLNDTMRVIHWLANNWLADGQRDWLAQSLGDEGVDRLVNFLGFTHDIGKATPAFQIKPSYDGNQSLDQELLEQLMRAGFSGLADTALASERQSPHALAGEAILEHFGVPAAIGAIIGGHHGKPESRPPRDQLSVYTANYWQKDHDPAIQQHWQAVQTELFQQGMKLAGYQAVAELPVIDQPQAVMLEGLLIMADWLASSESLGDDSVLFPLISIEQDLNDIDLTGRFENAMGNWYLGEDIAPQGMPDRDTVYAERFGYQPRPVQQKLTTVLDETIDPGIVIIEAPMGLGKTEIALVAAEQLAYRSGRRGLFFGLPTQATANAMFDRVVAWLQALPGTEAAVRSIELLHGKARFNQHFQQLPDAANIESKNAVSVNSWFSGKKRILDEFAVGTIDNLLVMALKQKHLALKHLGLSKKVIILDEVHAYDAYMSQYLYRAIRWLGAYHVPVVILSATLPKAKRNALLAAYFAGKYGRKLSASAADLSALPADWEQSEAYPLMTMLDGRKVVQITKFAGVSDQLPQAITVETDDAEDAVLIKQVIDSIAAGGVAGVIVNTVKRAQNLARMVPDDIPLIVLHSAFLAPDRTRQEQQLQAAIGKLGARPARMIVIGTQVLEQSLDIDFDILYTDIAPLDLLLQRAGRLHRHAITRPEQLQQPRMIVMGIQGPGKFADADELIYSRYLLLKTVHYLPAVLQLPTDISCLVQLVYDREHEPEIVGLQEAKAEFDAQIATAQKKAQVFQIKKPDRGRRATLHGWLDRSLTSVDKDEQRAQAAVRDIQETLEVILIRHTVVADQLVDGRPLAQCTSQEIAAQVVRLPRAVSIDINAAIAELEKTTHHFFSQWQTDKWLKGALVLPLDEHLTGTLGRWRLTYSPTLGLSYEPMEVEASEASI
ncbi:CRISPR-associated helicase Cas3' [Lacticaseibacillus baoqingensis]|uniref:CRISPR-associated helicase Cas3 n=1 Tax=Lacticaseibacillus baoqingensis TaxID=2486013 RepID=A0ABW4E6I1_9LACO|nr:CRISPR-associated helicase Cas3' [Lacticaseibacillus baoqingensis]